MLFIDLPLVFWRQTFSISSFYLVSQRELFSQDMAARLVISALPDGTWHWIDHHQHQGRDRSSHRQGERLRPHAEYNVESRKNKVAASKYRKRLGWVPWLELVIGSYFALTVYYAIQNENYVTIPFLLLFVVGYWYTGLMSLLQGRFSGVALSAESHTKPFPVGVVK